MKGLMDGFSGAHRIRNERGAVLALVVLMLIVFLGLAALAIDLGMMHVGRGEAQRAADAAAHAGAGHLIRSPTDEQGARDQAVRAGQQNRVRGGVVSIDRNVDVQVILDSAKVRAWVHRTAERENPVRTLFAGVLGIRTVNVAAMAAAEIYPAADAKCVLPIAVADRWCKSWNGTNCLQYSALDDTWETGDVYVPWVQNPTAPPGEWVYNATYTGYGQADRGLVMVLRDESGGGQGGGQGGGGGKGGSGSFGITPWFSTFIYDGEAPGGAANLIASRVLHCHNRTTTQQDSIIAGPGFMTPVVNAFETLISRDATAVWNQAANGGQGCVTTSGTMECRDSPRIRPIVLFDPREGPEGPAGSSDPFPVANLAGVFIEGAQATPASSSYVIARFVEYMGDHPSARGNLGGSLSKYLRIVE